MYQENLSKLPGRVAYVDESGSYGFDFSKDGTSKYYILTAVIVETERLEEFHQAVEEIKKNNGTVISPISALAICSNKAK